tara:strand:+ start:604 stop:1215 length:612 start_codon:yes stop_codon:yes gene_type:complete
MKTIIITGPSGSGKSFLSNKLSHLFSDTVLIKTDSYYRDSSFIKLLSIFVRDLYDRPLSIKRKELIANLKRINNKSSVINSYYYDFKRRKSLNKRIFIDYKFEEQFLIVEGIFAHRLSLNYQNTINIICEEEKLICFKRRLKRDQIERGRSETEVKEKFENSWLLFYQNIEEYKNIHETITINPIKKDSYNKLIKNLMTSKKN